VITDYPDQELIENIEYNVMQNISQLKEKDIVHIQVNHIKHIFIKKTMILRVLFFFFQYNRVTDGMMMLRHY
jgi:hypothetical protein